MKSTHFRHWIYLAGAVLFEVAGTSVMKLSQSEAWFVGPQAGYALMLAMIALSYYLLARAVMGLPVGVAFAFWEGLGLTLITSVSVLVLGEEMSLKRLLALFAVLSGAVLIHHGTGQSTSGSKSVEDTLEEKDEAESINKKSVNTDEAIGRFA